MNLDLNFNILSNSLKEGLAQLLMIVTFDHKSWKLKDNAAELEFSWGLLNCSIKLCVHSVICSKAWFRLLFQTLLYDPTKDFG